MVITGSLFRGVPILVIAHGMHFSILPSGCNGYLAQGGLWRDECSVRRQCSKENLI